MGNHLPISNSLWDPLLVHWPFEGQKLGHKGQRGKQKFIIVLGNQKLQCSANNTKVSLWSPDAASPLHPQVVHASFGKPSLTQCTLIKHTAPHDSPLCCILSQGSSKPDWTVPFLTPLYGRESNPVETLLGVSAFSICQVFFICRSLRRSRCNYPGLSLCFQCLLHQRNLPLK